MGPLRSAVSTPDVIIKKNKKLICFGKFFIMCNYLIKSTVEKEVIICRLTPSDNLFHRQNIFLKILEIFKFAHFQYLSGRILIHMNCKQFQGILIRCFKDCSKFLLSICNFIKILSYFSKIWFLEQYSTKLFQNSLLPNSSKIQKSIRVSVP